jgi:hypothetical protein
MKLLLGRIQRYMQRGQDADVSHRYQLLAQENQ